MTLLVIKDRNTNLADAHTVATTLCAVGIIKTFTGGIPFRAKEDYEGSIEVQCDEANLIHVKAGFLAAGFTVLHDPIRKR